MKEEIEIKEGVKIEVKKGDISEEEVDAVVNAANTHLIMGGGVAGALKKKGGKIIEEEAIKFAPIKKGEAITTSAGELKAKYIIHAATMELDFKTDESTIRAATKAALKEAKNKRIDSLAFPALGCGVGGFPIRECAKIMKEEIIDYWKTLPSQEIYPNKIVFCLLNPQDYQIFKEIWKEK
jgi:O-acetyl-ADP-ribose deacetylase (regulator of RNase III)